MAISPILNADVGDCGNQGHLGAERTLYIRWMPACTDPER